MSNLIVTRLAQLQPGGDVEVEVVADDMGTEDKGGVHVFDKDARYVDIPLPREGDVSGGELWKKRLSQNQLAGLDAGSLQATSFVDVPWGDGTVHRIWEGADHKVQEQGRDRLVDGPTDAAIGTYPQVRRAPSLELFSGKLTLDHVTQSMTGYKSGYGAQRLKGARFEPRGDFFPPDDTLRLLVIPVLSNTHRRIQNGDFFDARYVTKELVSLENMNLITLARQADGSYLASAPDAKAFTSVPTYNVYYGDSQDQRGYLVAVVGGAGKWDSRGGENYFIQI